MLIEKTKRVNQLEKYFLQYLLYSSLNISHRKNGMSYLEKNIATILLIIFLSSFLGLIFFMLSI